MNKSRSRQVYAGYTMIELLAVLTLLSLITALAVPRFTSKPQWHLEVASRRMAGDLRLLRQAAINTGESCKIDYYIYTNRYELSLPDGKERISLPQGVRFDGTTTFSGVPPSLQFNNMGRPSSGGTVILEAGGFRRYVIVAPVTGRVRVSREPPLHW